MGKFTIPCSFGDSVAPYVVHIGVPKAGNHPLHFQAAYITKHKNGEFSQDIMDKIADMSKLAQETQASLEEMCRYTLDPVEKAENPEDDDEEED